MMQNIHIEYYCPNPTPNGQNRHNGAKLTHLPTMIVVKCHKFSQAKDNFDLALSQLQTDVIDQPTRTIVTDNYLKDLESKAELLVKSTEHLEALLECTAGYAPTTRFICNAKDFLKDYKEKYGNRSNIRPELQI